MLDNVTSTIESALRLARPATWRLVADVARAARLTFRLARRARPTSLNAPVGPARRLATVRLDLVTAKRVARAHDCGVNDVVLGLVTGGVRALLAGRGEPIELLRPRAGIAVALFSPGHGTEAGNDIGTLHVPLPIGEADPSARLRLIARETARARRSRMVAAEPILRAWFGRFGVFRRALDHQRLVNLAETYLPGPPGRSTSSAPRSWTCSRSHRWPATLAFRSWRSHTPDASRSPSGWTPTSSQTSTCCLPPWSGTGRPCPPR